MFPGCGSHNYFGDFSHILSRSNLLYSYQTSLLFLLRCNFQLNSAKLYFLKNA